MRSQREKLVLLNTIKRTPDVAILRLYELYDSIVLKHGDKGDVGERGDRGEKGDRGFKGDQGERGPVGPIGPKGDKGDRGVDGKDGKDGKRGEKGQRGERGERGEKGDNGKDGSPDTPQEVRDKLASLTGEDRLDASAIKNLPQVLQRFGESGRGRKGGGGASTFLQLLDAPNSYSGQGLKAIRVNASGTGLEFYTPTSIASTDELAEGLTNFYFTNERAQDAVGNSVGNGLDYDDSSGAISVDESELSHNSLSGLTTGDAHTQYIFVSPSSDTRNIIQPTAADIKGLVLKGFTSQTENLLEFQNSSGTLQNYFASDGNLVLKQGNTPTNPPLRFPDGSGFYQNNNGEIQMSVGGVGRYGFFTNEMRVDNNIRLTSPGKYVGIENGTRTEYNGGNGVITYTDGGERFRIKTNETIFNDLGADSDFRCEGDTDPNLLFTDGSTDRVGIGTNTPGYKLHVAGDINSTGVYRVSGTAGVSGSFTTADAKTVTVTSGIITSIV